MSLTRRDALKSIGGLAATAAFGKLGAQEVQVLRFTQDDTPFHTHPLFTDFPRKDDFTIAPGYTYINAAYTHPMPRAGPSRWNCTATSLPLSPSIRAHNEAFPPASSSRDQWLRKYASINQQAK